MLTGETRLDQFAFQSPGLEPSAATSLTFVLGWTHTLGRDVSLSIDGGPRVTNGSLAPELGAAIQMRRVDRHASLAYARTQTPVLGLPGVAAAHSFAAAAGWRLGRSIEAAVSPSFVRSTLGMWRADSSRLAIDINRRLADGVSIGFAGAAGVQRGNLQTDGRGTIRRNEIMIRVIAGRPQREASTDGGNRWRASALQSLAVAALGAAFALPAAAAQRRQRVELSHRLRHRTGGCPRHRRVEQHRISRTVPVRPDGRISLPLLNDVQAAGFTPMQLRDTLTTSLATYVATPSVSVIVREVHSFKVTVLGEVKTPGRYELKSRSTVLDVLAMAGGPTDYAERERMVVLRQQGASTEQIPFSVEKAIARRKPGHPSRPMRARSTSA